MPDTLKILLLIFAMAGITYLIRMIPTVFLRKKIKSTYLKSLLYYIPYAVLSAMTFPAIFYATGDTLSAVIGTAVALIVAVFRLSLIIVALLACAAVFIVIII
ncbi:MAG: AzlD domain-containing protein [Clostridia bacterium]|nr:AzlD domain-containing protein [Clostridia bacterium]